MITKTYRTTELKGLTLHVMIDGKMAHIAFKRGCTLGSTATFTTEDKKIQDALESLKAFGTTYILEKEVVTGEETKVAEAPKVVPEPIEEEEKEVVDILDAQTFKNIVELKNALRDKGVDVSQITNVKVAESIARKNGYNYTIEKNA